MRDGILRIRRQNDVAYSTKQAGEIDHRDHWSRFTIEHFKCSVDCPEPFEKFLPHRPNLKSVLIYNI